MSYELISDEEYSNLPLEDDRCFIEFESICRRNMTRMIDQDTSTSFDQTVREQYMSAVYAVAQECNVTDVLWYSGSPEGFNGDFRSFSLSVQGAVARMRIRLRGQNHPYSVLLTSSTRTKVEHYVSRIRDLIEKSEMDPERKKRLDERLDLLLKEFGNRRVSFASTMAILVGLTTTIAGVVTIAADGQKAVAQIMALIGADKETEEAAAQRLSPPLKALPAPEVKRPAIHVKPARPKPNYDLDEDIPF
ncbi:hypothetical protein [Methylobacterium iners]|uniref:Uncharacterized protein n=1 Tax=Methylobacterium iners TaxID=418707 RepID=A0ABQ4S3X4_9HYPH|nr:hypothetical protein [Methylobacterium iners]GJD96599.1 hypothetical protein OCOJLMKI_3822 [Methylobacterium iners]